MATFDAGALPGFATSIFFDANPTGRLFMMRPATCLHIIAGTILAATLLPSSGTAQTYLVRKVGSTSPKGYDDVHISKAAIAGQQVRIWWATLLNPDCTAAGTMTTQILDQPRHGQVRISDDLFYPNFVQPNPRASCDRQKSPGKQAFYTADAGFHGHDKLVINNATSEGRIRRIIVDIDVR
ncbi:hypothetical protein MOK15_13050 [Sphingobium sp. BYY-5]|uniref:hypothetical protein n=1 Tax=Sphingobium sp. BYY-5 TaxID=2926400 RepID=UPI001FA804B3|nr:hypothetical protein [Sphingobium sp. BYY-5]MCI4591014.1 hypothetical protein [Sphingobium sp. BYY-5]